jgi:hypothetical protein
VLETCDYTLSCGPDPERCGRPRDHTSWSIHAGWPLGTVSPGAHSIRPQSYDAEVAPYLIDGARL